MFEQISEYNTILMKCYSI